MDANINYREITTDCIVNLLSKIDDEIGDIINDCESGNYSMNEIVDSLKSLKKKVY